MMKTSWAREPSRCGANLLEVNPDVLIYAPPEGAFFRSALPQSFLAPAPGLRKEMRYFEGEPPQRPLSGSPWRHANFSAVTATNQIFPDSQGR